MVPETLTRILLKGTVTLDLPSMALGLDAELVPVGAAGVTPAGVSALVICGTSTNRVMAKASAGMRTTVMTRGSQGMDEDAGLAGAAGVPSVAASSERPLRASVVL